MMNEQLFVLIRVAFGYLQQLSRQLSPEEWQELYEQAQKQSLIGVCMYGISKLPHEQKPKGQLYWKWLAIVTRIQHQNIQLDQQTSIIWKQLKEDGLDSAILKGQGIAQEYGELAQFRQSGDIDIWVKGGYQIVCNYVQRTHPTDDVAYHRFHYNYFSNTEVELHHRPTLMRNLFDDRKLRRWYNSFKAEDFVYLENKGFAVPPAKFNSIFILTHIYRHFLFEGIGLRQVMDYYFVLKGHPESIGSPEPMLKDLRLTRFAEAMMWILHTQFGLEERYLICGMNEKEGRFVLSEIGQTGNFGQRDVRYAYKHFQKLRRQIAHSIHLLLHYPSEVLWTPVWLVYHKIWKWNKKRKIRKGQK